MLLEKPDAGGFVARPMQHKCATRGCYLETAPRLNILARLLPGRRPGVMDIDGAFEWRGRVLFFEFKDWRGPGELPTAQRIFYERLTSLSPHIRVLVACADPATMRARCWREVSEGQFGPWQTGPCAADAFEARVRELGERMDTLPRPRARWWRRLLKI